MLFKKVPIAATPIRIKEVMSSFTNLSCGGRARGQLIEYLGLLINRKYPFFLNSGVASFFVILEALKRISDRKEVILPAYTAGSLIVAIKKANLKPVLCDIALNDFNMDLSLLPNLVSGNTLCILGVHMFGIVTKGLDNLKGRYHRVFVIEDCAQGFGSRMNNVLVGNIGDLSFFSFNRGKNLSTCGGGCIGTDNKELAEKIESACHEYAEIHIKRWEEIGLLLKILALSLVVKPQVYGILHLLISRFKDLKPQEDFKIKEYTNLQAGLALSMLKKAEGICMKRYLNGMYLIAGLSDINEVILPKVAQDTMPAFNRLPVLFKDLRKREIAEKKLWDAGIETSRIYLRPLHHMFDLGYKKEDFPNANYLAEHLLTLPVHPLVKESDLSRMVEVIKGI